MGFALAVAAPLFALGIAVFPTGASAQDDNLVPNWNFSDRSNPLGGWRVDFPYQGAYVKNASYVKISETMRDGDSPSVELDLPKGVAENEGGKVETALIKIEPGATYRYSVDCLTNDLAAKLYVEVYAPDPTGTPIGASIVRVPAGNGLPALVQCYRAPTDDPPVKSKAWVTEKRDFTVPANVIIAGKPSHPVYAAIKAWGLAEWVGGSGKIYFSKFVLKKIKSAPASSGDAALP